MPGVNQKTVFGLVAFIISTVVGQLLLGLDRSLIFIVLSSISCGFTEVYSGDLDNISIVLVFILFDAIF